jgi:hypothetical protein
MPNNLQGKTIAILATDGFEQVEFTKPKRALEEAGARTQVVSPTDKKIKAGTKKGSGRESVETFDLRGFISCVQFDSSSRRRCGNVETRVPCGFPSSEGGQNRCGRRSIIPPSERHFHSEAPVYRPFWRECVVWAAGGAK